MSTVLQYYPVKLGFHQVRFARAGKADTIIWASAVKLSRDYKPLPCDAPAPSESRKIHLSKRASEGKADVMETGF
jgi:hypothetical protein